MLTRSLYGEARALRLARRGGHRWEALELLNRAERIRRRDRLVPAKDDRERAVEEAAVDRSMLRSEAIASLILTDARQRRQWTGLRSAISPDRRFLGLQEMTSTQGAGKLRCRIVNLESGEDTLLTESTMLTESRAPPSIGLGPEGETLLTVDTVSGQVSFWDLQGRKRNLPLSWPEFPIAPSESS